MLIPWHKLLCFFVLLLVADTMFAKPAAAYDGSTPKEGFFFLVEPVPDPLSEYIDETIIVGVSDQDKKNNLFIKSMTSRSSLHNKSQNTVFMESPVRLVWKSYYLGTVLVCSVGISFYTHLLQAPVAVLNMIGLATLIITGRFGSGIVHPGDRLKPDHQALTALAVVDHKDGNDIKVVDMNVILNGESVAFSKVRQGLGAWVGDEKSEILSNGVISSDYTTIYVGMMLSGGSGSDRREHRKNTEGLRRARIKRMVLEIAKALNINISINEKGDFVVDGQTGRNAEYSAVLTQILETTNINNEQLRLLSETANTNNIQLRLYERFFQSIRQSIVDPLTRQAVFSSFQAGLNADHALVNQMPPSELENEGMILEGVATQTEDTSTEMRDAATQTDVENQFPAIVNLLRQHPRSAPVSGGEPSSSGVSQFAIEYSEDDNSESDNNTFEQDEADQERQPCGVWRPF